MDYAEADWTPRTGIDLARFAGRTVTLTMEVTAKSNVCIEVFGKAWLADIVIDDDDRHAKAVKRRSCGSRD